MIGVRQSTRRLWNDTPTWAQAAPASLHTRTGWMSTRNMLAWAGPASVHSTATAANDRLMERTVPLLDSRILLLSDALRP